MDAAWEDLEQLCREIEARDAAVAERRTHGSAEREAVKSWLELIDRQWQELGLEAALEQVRERLLGGVGVVQRISAAYGLDRMAALMWPADVDPRAELSAAKGEYRVEVWLGIGEQGQPRVRVVGAKRLEATLPVAAEKFRGVLLDAVRAPAFLSAEQSEATQEAREAAPPPPETEAQPEPEPEARPAPPAEDEPIAMGPASTEDTPPRGPRGRGRKSGKGGPRPAAPSS